VNIEKMKEDIAKVNWWHSIKLGDIVTKGAVSTSAQNVISQLIPKDLTGKTVLDIGAWDGYYSFECEKRGAKRVVAIDNLQRWKYKSMLGFETAKKYLDSKVEFYHVDAYDICTFFKESFDIILLFGIFYHVPDPVLLFKNLYKKCNECVLIEGEVNLRTDKVMELKDWKTNYWWVPSLSCLLEIIKIAGFKPEVFQDGTRPSIKAFK